MNKDEIIAIVFGVSDVPIQERRCPNAKHEEKKKPQESVAIVSVLQNPKQVFCTDTDARGQEIPTQEDALKQTEFTAQADKPTERSIRKADSSPAVLPLPSIVDNTRRDCLVVDNIYYSYLYVTGYGYPNRNSPAWLSPLVEAGENIGFSLYVQRMPKDTVLKKIAQTTMLNRARMRDVDDTRSDYEELDSAIYSGLFLKDGMNRDNEDFYYMHIVIEVKANSYEALQKRLEAVQTFCLSMDWIVKRCTYKQEQAFLSSLPLLSPDADLMKKGRRNILTESLAAAFPFSSLEVCDPNGILLGINSYNHSLTMVDIFDTEKYLNANVCVLGMSGAGKSYFLQLMALRLRQQGVPVMVVVPLKGYEYRPACEAIGGKYIKLSASSRDCINFLDIRRRNLNTDYEVRSDDRSDSVLAAKIQSLMVFFTLRKPDITQQELSLIDSALYRTYAKKGISEDNSTLFKKDGTFKEMPTAVDLYNELLENEATAYLAPLLELFVSGSLRNLGKQTNVDLDNEYIVIDISEMNNILKPLFMYIATEAIGDKIKESRIRKKALVYDELSILIGAASNELAADFVLEQFKAIRGFGGSIIGASQDTNDYFALENGKYGKGILSNSQFKILLRLEEDEARTLQAYMGLTDTETVQVTRNRRGQALLFAGRTRLSIELCASQTEHDLVTTDRQDLLRQAEQR